MKGNEIEGRGVAISMRESKVVPKSRSVNRLDSGSCLKFSLLTSGRGEIL